MGMVSMQRKNMTEGVRKERTLQLAMRQGKGAHAGPTKGSKMGSLNSLMRQGSPGPATDGKMKLPNQRMRQGGK